MSLDLTRLGCFLSESPQHLLLQALNDQNQAAIDERLATEGVKDWINRRALPEQLDNPVRQFKVVRSITCLTFASLVSDDATVRQLVEAGADAAVTDSRKRKEEVYSPLHYACASDVPVLEKKSKYHIAHESTFSYKPAIEVSKSIDFYCEPSGLIKDVILFVDPTLLNKGRKVSLCEKLLGIVPGRFQGTEHDDEEILKDKILVFNLVPNSNCVNVDVKIGNYI